MFKAISVCNVFKNRIKTFPLLSSSQNTGEMMTTVENVLQLQLIGFSAVLTAARKVCLLVGIIAVAVKVAVGRLTQRLGWDQPFFDSLLLLHSSVLKPNLDLQNKVLLRKSLRKSKSSILLVSRLIEVR